MQITWHGHACFELKDSKNTILIDPHDGKSIGIKPPISNSNIILVTHNHYDHNATRVVNTDHKDVLFTEGISEINGQVFEGFATFHDENEGNNRGNNIIYKFNTEGLTICHCGDLGSIPSNNIIENLKDIDILFVPTGEIYTINLLALKEFIKIINPKIIIPMHYRVGGLTMPLKTLDDFIFDIPKERIIYVGNKVEIYSEDIAEFTGYWVFDR